MNKIELRKLAKKKGIRITRPTGGYKTMSELYKELNINPKKAGTKKTGKKTVIKKTVTKKTVTKKTNAKKTTRTKKPAKKLVIKSQTDFKNEKLYKKLNNDVKVYYKTEDGKEKLERNIMPFKHIYIRKSKNGYKRLVVFYEDKNKKVIAYRTDVYPKDKEIIEDITMNSPKTKINRWLSKYNGNMGQELILPNDEKQFKQILAILKK